MKLKDKDLDNIKNDTLVFAVEVFWPMLLFGVHLIARLFAPPSQTDVIYVGTWDYVRDCALFGTMLMVFATLPTFMIITARRIHTSKKREAHEK